MWNASRKPLVGQFTFNGKDVFVIANHFDAKLGDQSQDGRFQFPAQSSAVQRAGQALSEHNFINQILARSCTSTPNSPTRSATTTRRSLTSSPDDKLTR